MSAVAFIEGMVAAGFSYEDAIKAARVYEQVSPANDVKPSSRGAERTRRWRERKDASQSVTDRHEASQSVTPSQSLSPSLPPQTPPTHPHTRVDISTRVRADDFETFWAAYPAKVGKKAAVSAWAKATDRPPIHEVLAAIERYRLAKPPDREWCHPATWLNQGRWEDQSPEPKGLFAYEPQPANDRNPRPDGSQSRAARDQSAALRVLARRGLLGGPDGGGGDHEGGPAGSSALGG